jgi:glyoxylase-like metal-dependent hydrolase (beta-lactamase superfamily II)
MGSQLNYAVHVSPLHPLAAGGGLNPPDGAPAYWSPLSTTLVYGPTEAVLIDPPITRDQGRAVATWASGFGRTVSAIYITHAHGDHWFATTTLLERFPAARVLATAGTVAEMHRVNPGGRHAPFWDALFPGLIGETPIRAEALPADGLAVDGEPIRPITVGHSDTDHTTVVHVPSLDLVVAGDVIYNRVHQYLAESGDGGLDAWLAAVDRVTALAPATVIAGHKDPDRPDTPSIIDDTRRYLEAAAAVLADGPDRRRYYDQMVARFPQWLNPTIAWLSAVRRLAA